MKTPRCNGRPQLWISTGIQGLDKIDRLRIIYPDGKVEYWRERSWLGDGYWLRGCTSRKTQREAILACKKYWPKCLDKHTFLGYL